MCLTGLWPVEVCWQNEGHLEESGRGGREAARPLTSPLRKHEVGSKLVKDYQVRKCGSELIPPAYG